MIDNLDLLERVAWDTEGPLVMTWTISKKGSRQLDQTNHRVPPRLPLLGCCDRIQAPSQGDPIQFSLERHPPARGHRGRVPRTPSAETGPGRCILSGEKAACKQLVSNKAVGESRRVQRAESSAVPLTRERWM